MKPTLQTLVLSLLRSMWSLNEGFPNLGYIFGGPYNTDYSILGSILGSPYFGKLPNSPKPQTLKPDKGEPGNPSGP